jgi:prepilin-type N-terminal cleavage/methylation domain-containing protein
VSRRSEQGFTLIEIMLAVIVLSVGVMALVGSSALATRMIGGSNTSSRVAQVASARAELLRATAARTAACGSVTSGTVVTAGITEQWTLGGAAGDLTRDVQMSFAYKTPRGQRTETTTLTLFCK